MEHGQSVCRFAFVVSYLRSFPVTPCFFMHLRKNEPNDTTAIRAHTLTLVNMVQGNGESLIDLCRSCCQKFLNIISMQNWGVLSNQIFTLRKRTHREDEKPTHWIRFVWDQVWNALVRWNSVLTNMKTHFLTAVNIFCSVCMFDANNLDHRRTKQYVQLSFSKEIEKKELRVVTTTFFEFEP